MNIDELYTILDDLRDDDGLMTLTGDVLSEAAADLLSAYLDGEALRFAGVTLRGPIEGRIILQGRCQTPIFAAMVVRGTFVIIDDAPAFHLTFTAAEDWTPAESFPALAGTLLPRLSFADVKLTLATYTDDENGIAEGLALNGTLGLSGPLAGLGWLLGGKQRLALAGTFVPNDDALDFTLAGAVQTPITLGSYELTDTTCAVAGSIDRAQGDAEAAIHVTATLAHGEIALAFNGDFDPDAETLALVGAPPEDTTLTLDEVAVLLGTGAPLGDLVPDRLSIADDIALETITLSINLAEKTLAEAAAALKTAQPWTVIDNVLSFDAVSLIVTVDDPLGGAATTAELTAELALT